jgi:hypothetical protein
MEFNITIKVEDGRRVDVAMHEALAELFRASEDGLILGVQGMPVDESFEVEDIGGCFGVQSVIISRIE